MWVRRRRQQRAGRTQLWRLSAGHARSTENMFFMFVTLDVSKLSGWLNVEAYCRVGKGSIGRGATCAAGRREGVGRRRRSQRAGRTQLWRLLAGHARSAP